MSSRPNTPRTTPRPSTPAAALQSTLPAALHEYLPGRIWLCSYPVTYLGMRLSARMTVLRLADGTLMLHSPCEIDAAMRSALATLGEVSCLVAPGTFHHLHVASAQRAFPNAKTYLCSGLERRRPQIRFDHLLADEAPAAWTGEFEQALVRGNRWICEVAFYHRSSRTLIVVDLLENIGDRTPAVAWQLKLWFKWVFHMWNTPKPAPEYQLGWSDRSAARASLQRIMQWDFERVILSHGDLIDANARELVQHAWGKILS